MLKVDKPFIREFLGVDEVNIEVISRCKTHRLYSAGDKTIVVSTPLIESEVGNILGITQKFSPYKQTITKHKRGKYSIYEITTFNK